MAKSQDQFVRQCLTQHTKTLADLDKKVDECRLDIRGLKTQARMWGGFAALVVSVLGWFIPRG
jgi:hypothetical protein